MLLTPSRARTYIRRGTINDNIYVVFELSEEWCAPLTALQEQLAVVQRALNPMSFRKLSQTLCKQLNDHCVQRCLSAAVSDNIALSHASGKRLKSNVRTMIHTIGAFVPRADNYFREYGAVPLWRICYMSHRACS